MKTTLLIFILQLSGCSSPCAPEQYFFSKDLATMANLAKPPQDVFQRGEVPAVVVSGADYYGRDLLIEVFRQLPNGKRIPAGARKYGHLKTPDAFCYWFGNLPPGQYIAILSVDGAYSRDLGFTVL